MLKSCFSKTGHVEKGETLEEAVMREAVEECGFEISIVDVFDIVYGNKCHGEQYGGSCAPIHILGNTHAHARTHRCIYVYILSCQGTLEYV